MDRIEVTHAELVAALAEAANVTDDGGGAMTSSELSRATGRGEKWLRDHIRSLLAEDRAEVVFVQRRDIAGRPTRVPAYRLKAA